MKPRLGVRAAVALVGWAGVACGPQATAPPTPPGRTITAAEALAWPARPYDVRIPYGPAPQQFGELRLPAADGPAPVAVVIHGGCWLSIADNDYMDGVAETFTAAGWATWNLEFRTLDQPGGGWPGTLLDVGAGIDALRDVADEHPLDLDRVIVVGHSSGGHLALWAAARGGIPPGGELHAPDPLPIRGAIGLSAIADIEAYRAMDVPACGDTPVRLLGGLEPAEAPHRLAQVSPALLRASAPPQFLVTGSGDGIVPPRHGNEYERLLQADGLDVVHHVIPGAGHFEVVDVDGATWGVMWPLIGDFLERVAGG